MSDKKQAPVEPGLDAPVLDENRAQSSRTDESDGRNERGKAIELPLEEGQFDSQPG